MQREKEKMESSSEHRLQRLSEEKDKVIREKDAEIRKLRDQMEQLEHKELSSEQRMNEQVEISLLPSFFNGL